jgi:Flp pilus assembly secretin CpaC
MKRSMYLATLFAVLMGSSALAEPLFVPVGQSITLTLPSSVARVSVEDSQVLQARKKGSGSVVLVGKSTGNTQVRVRTGEGETLELTIGVHDRGVHVYSMAALTKR